MRERPAGNRKIVDETEVKRWFEEGRTYQEMVDTYAEKYDIAIGVSAFANFRRRHGLELRITRDEDLIPWAVLRTHRYANQVNMLRTEARRRANAALTEREERVLTSWLRGLERDDVVVHYDPDTEQGWFYVPRLPSDDDIIRRPEHVTKQGHGQ